MKRLDDLLFGAGTLTIAAGVGLIHVPSGVIALGAAMVVASLLLAKSGEAQPGGTPEKG